MERTNQNAAFGVEKGLRIGRTNQNAAFDNLRDKLIDRRTDSKSKAKCVRRIDGRPWHP